MQFCWQLASRIRAEPISKIYFWNKTLHVSDSTSVHHQEFFTVHTAMVYVIQVLLTACEQDQGGTAAPSWFCSQAVSKPVWHIPLLCVQWKTPDDGQRDCPKHVEYYSKNKFDKLVHLVGFIINIYHNARSPERRISSLFWDVTQRWSVLIYRRFGTTSLSLSRLQGSGSRPFTLEDGTDRLSRNFGK